METQLMSYPCTCGRPTSCHAPRPRPAHRACTLAVWSLDTVTWSKEHVVTTRAGN